MGSPTFRFAFGKRPLTVANAPWTSLTTNAVSTQFHRCEALVTATRQDRLRDPQLTASFPQFVTNMQREEKCRKSKLSSGHESAARFHQQRPAGLAVLRGYR